MGHMLIIIAILAGLLFFFSWGEEAGLFAALMTYLFGAFWQQRRRLAEVEQEVRRLGAALSAMKQTYQDNAKPVEQPIGEFKAATPSPGVRVVKPIEDSPDEEPMELDVDFDLLDESSPTPTPPSPKREAVRGAQRRAAGNYEKRLLGWIKNYFASGNLIVKVGVIVLFFGVAFLLKYAADQSLLPIELRLTGTALGGLALLIFGWRLRHRRENYALTLQGGAVGVLYLTVFAALRLYSVIPPGLAFGLLLLFVALSALLALLQDSKVLIVLATAGGFLAPILTSTGEGSHVALFSYYLVLNAGILLIAWFKAWRILNLVGFAFTFVIGTLWGVEYLSVGVFLLYRAISGGLFSALCGDCRAVRPAPAPGPERTGRWHPGIWRAGGLSGAAGCISQGL